MSNPPFRLLATVRAFAGHAGYYALC
jgi:hypothetical protein